MTVVALGTVETPYWQNNPGSRENLPQTDPRLVPVLTPEQAAEAIVDGVEQKKRFVVKPGIFRHCSCSTRSSRGSSPASSAVPPRNLRLETEIVQEASSRSARRVARRQSEAR